MRLILLVGVSVALGGCIQAMGPHFTPNGDGTYVAKFNSKATLYSPDDPEAEVKRLALLETRIEQEGFCLQGYEITNREVVRFRYPLQVGKEYQIFYQIKCNSE